MTTTILTIPGLWNSGPEHWQTLWEAADFTFRRVQQADWETPRCEDWVENLDAAIAAVIAAGSDVILVAHSLGCATVAHWSRASRRPVRGAFLVAPSDVEAPIYPPGTSGFSPMPLEPLRFPSLVVNSPDDPWISSERARQFAAAWGSRFVEIAPAGHINSASGLGDWPEGRSLLAELQATVKTNYEDLR
jgi:predicted alpha/beta hydrolase family esterase